MCRLPGLKINGKVLVSALRIDGFLLFSWGMPPESDPRSITHNRISLGVWI